LLRCRGTAILSELRVLTTLLILDKYPDREVAIAVPDRLTFHSLVERLKPQLQRLGIGAQIIHENGQVIEAFPSRNRRAAIEWRRRDRPRLNATSLEGMPVTACGLMAIQTSCKAVGFDALLVPESASDTGLEGRRRGLRRGHLPGNTPGKHGQVLPLTVVLSSRCGTTRGQRSLPAYPVLIMHRLDRQPVDSVELTSTELPLRYRDERSAEDLVLPRISVGARG
jgi:hypothetical protein